MKQPSLNVRLQKSISAHPGAWILTFLLAVAEFGNWKLGRTLDQVCRLADTALELDESAPSDVLRLETEDSLEGRVFRWRMGDGSALESICAERDATEDGEDEP